MLNIATRISLSRASRNCIRQLKARQNGKFTQGSWAKVHKSVKNEFSSKIFANQGLKCVYCERYLIGLGHEIDHFAHKKAYPEFSFTPVNLFYSCKLCNSSERKGQKNTVNVRVDNYRNCSFHIVHPYFDDPDQEIVYTDADKIILDRVSSSVKGNATIDFFQLDDLLYTTIRSKTLILERLNPLLTTEERLLIQSAIAYK